MSIANQITRINTAKADIKEVVNQDFEKIQDETITYYPEKIAETIEEYKKYIPEKSYSGTEINVDDAIPLRVPMIPKANTYQKQLSGKNLYDNNGETTEYYINAYGYRTKGSNGDIFIETLIDSNIASNYVVSFSEMVGTAYIRFSFFNGDSFISRELISVTNSVVTVPTETTKIYIHNDKRAEKYFANLQIEKGSTATEYEPYCGGQPSPNPEYPQEIKVVTGNNVVNHLGKNLLNLSNGRTNHGVTTTMKNDGSVDLKGTTDTTWFNLTDVNKIRLLPGKYTFSVNKTLNFSLRIRAYYKDNPNDYFNISIDSGKTSGTFTVPRECSNFYVFAFGLTTGAVIDLNIKLQLEEGSVATEYEPYREEEYKLDLWKENEFDKDNVNKLNAYIDSSNKITSSEATRTLYVECKKNTLYKISKAKSARFRAIYTTDIPAINIVGNGYIVNDAGKEIIIKTGNNAKYLCVFYYHANQDTLTEQEILESIQIQEAIELCKIGDYSDILFKNVSGDENYNAELEDGAWYKKKIINKRILDESENWAIWEGVFLLTIINDYKDRENTPICDYYKGIANVQGTANMTTNNTIAFNLNHSGLPRFFVKDERYSTV